MINATKSYIVKRRHTIRYVDGSGRRHQMGTFSALLVLCEGNPPVTGKFPSQWPEVQSFDVFLDVRLSKHSIRR